MRDYRRILVAALALVTMGPAVFSQILGATGNVGSMTVAVADSKTTEATADTADALEPSLIAVGTVGAANVYYSYLAIGSAADSFVSGSYDGPLATAIANEVLYLNAGTMKSLQAMIVKNGLSPEDKTALKFLVDTYDVLNKQAKELVKFIGDKKNDGAAYQEYRSAAWTRIQKLFSGSTAN